MFEIFRISLFGHRNFEEYTAVEKGINTVLAEVLCKEECVEIYTGRNGEFDIFSASVIKCFLRSRENKNCELTLVLPYTVKDIDYYQEYYDNVIVPIKTHPKAAITSRNKWMVENSDLVLVYVKNSHGGAYEAMRYAEILNKKIINLAQP